MNRRKFISDSAIVGAAVTIPSLVTATSGMYATEKYRKVRQVLTAGRSFVGTLPIMRAFAGGYTDYVSPFVLFDEFGPVDITPGQDALKVEAHPHAGVTPTTYLLSGSGHHKDSLDYDFQIQEGEFMMFNSGRGAIHMEESGEEVLKHGGSVHGFQIWLNMPSKYKFADPTTIVHQAPSMPAIQHEDFTAKVVMGELFGCKSNIETLSPAFYYHIELYDDSRLDIPTDPTHNAFIYVVNGELEISDQQVLKKHQIALYERGATDINLYSNKGAEFFVLGGKPLDEVVYSYGPFVMNTEEQINQCIMNYRMGRMGDPEIVNR